MKFLWAFIAYLAMAAVLAWGILRLAAGKPGLLIAAVLGYVVLLGVIGCLPKKSHG